MECDGRTVINPNDIVNAFTEYFGSGYSPNINNGHTNDIHVKVVGNFAVPLPSFSETDIISIAKK